MATRIDFYDDPDAPEANSLVPSVNVIVTNPSGDVLMIRRTDNNNWALPGGAIDLGESIPQAAIRETFEETGIRCEITGISGTYSDPRHVILYTSNGEVRQEFSLVLTARYLSGQLTPSNESREVRWVPRQDQISDHGPVNAPADHPLPVQECSVHRLDALRITDVCTKRHIEHSFSARRQRLASPASCLPLR